MRNYICGIMPWNEINFMTFNQVRVSLIKLSNGVKAIAHKWVFKVKKKKLTMQYWDIKQDLLENGLLKKWINYTKIFFPTISKKISFF